MSTKRRWETKKKIALLHCPRNVTTLKVEGVAFRLGLNLTHCYLEKEKPFCNREKRLLSGSLLLLLFRLVYVVLIRTYDVLQLDLHSRAKYANLFCFNPFLTSSWFFWLESYQKSVLPPSFLQPFSNQIFLFENVNKIYQTFWQLRKCICSYVAKKWIHAIRCKCK